MKIEVAEHARMSERGSSLLRLIQNNDMPILDLLIRESVQNSLDAALAGSGNVKIDFSVRNFSSLDINEHLEGIKDNINNQFPDNTYKVLEIRDSNTVGLTGPLHYNDVVDDHFGNLLKLVYEISMPQQKEGAGGSWGLGKTVYFRIGIGLVFYYSRVKDGDGSYSSRLAACLVEDERKPDSLINLNNGKPKRGIAWWGQPADEKSTMPLTDENEIRDILSVFNSRPFTGEETGTAIIIPYINEQNLLEGILPESQSEEDNSSYTRTWWSHSIQDYIKVAVQKWYAPRLMNPSYPYGRWLDASVNGKEIESAEMLPLFRIAQALYNRTPLSEVSEHTSDILHSIEVSTERIALRNMFNEDTTAGYISYVKVSKEQLLMNYPHNNTSPYIQLNKYDVPSDYNFPIIMYVRKPGMIVGYETTGEWVDGIPKTNPNEFIIGIFVAKSTNTLKNTAEKITLEEYIRKSEKADHTSWTDWAYDFYKPFIVSKIQRQVRKVISSKFVKTNNELYKNKNMALGRSLAGMLLPPENFGTKSTLPGGGKDGKDGHSGRRVNYGLKFIGSPQYSDGLVHLEFELSFGQKQSLGMQLQALSESGGISADFWEMKNIIGKEFPLRLERVQISSVHPGGKAVKQSPGSFIVDRDSSEVTYGNVHMQVLKTERFHIPYGVTLSLIDKNGYTLKGKASFISTDRNIKGGLTLSSEGDGKK